MPRARRGAAGEAGAERRALGCRSRAVADPRAGHSLAAAAPSPPGSALHRPRQPAGAAGLGAGALGSREPVAARASPRAEPRGSRSRGRKARGVPAGTNSAAALGEEARGEGTNCLGGIKDTSENGI